MKLPLLVYGYIIALLEVNVFFTITADNLNHPSTGLFQKYFGVLKMILSYLLKLLFLG